MAGQSWAVQYRQYGGPNVLTRASMDAPRPRADEVLVRVVATSVNRLDLVLRSGGLRVHGRGFPKGTGFDLLGVVEGANAAVPDLPAGTAVWGMLGLEPLRTRGTAAQYLALRRDQLGIVPGEADPHLAALPLVAATALAALRDRLRVRPGQRVLVVGASGGIGTAALQLLRWAGVQADAVAVERHRESCLDLGAETVFARDRDEVPEEAVYDGVLLAGGCLADHVRCCRPDGRIVAVAGDAWLRDVPRAVTDRLSRRASPWPSTLSVGPNPADLDLLGRLAVSGELRPVVERTYPVDRIAEAHRDQEAGGTRGKRVVVH